MSGLNSLSSPSKKILILKSPAKLNLYLKVLNKRKDGYHNLVTIFEKIDLCDTIMLKARKDKKIKIICRQKGVPQDKSNLAFQAAQLLQDNLKINKGVEIKIIKRIPIGSGLGGGSSNAATVLKGLNRLWNLGLKQERLISFSQKLGSDVTFFIYNFPFALGKERGDRIIPLNSLKNLNLWHLLVVPPFSVSTALVYKKWDKLGFFKQKVRLTKIKQSVKMSILALKKNKDFKEDNFLFNDLESISMELFPEIKSIQERLKNLGIKKILMSGTGPALFDIVSSRKEAVSLWRRIKKENNMWQVFVVRTFRE